LEWYERDIGYLLICVANHFALGLLVGFCVFWLTSTTLLRWQSVLRIQDSHIRGISLFLALSLSVVVHLWEDYYIKRF